MELGARTTERLVALREAERAGIAAREPRATRAYVADDRVVLAPRGVGEILDTAWDIFSARFLGCTGVALALTLPYRGALIAVRQSGVSQETRTLLELGSAFLVPLLVAVLMANLVRDHVEGRRSSPWESVRATFDRLPSLALVAVMIALGQGCAASLVCCFPISFAVYWVLSVVPAVYTIERRPLLELVPRSWQLLRGWGNFGRWLGWVSVQTVMVVGLSTTVAAVDEPRVRAWILEATSFDGLTLDLVAAVPVALFTAVLAAFSAVTMTVYYFEVRARKEGLDLRYRLLEIVEESRGDDDANGSVAGANA